MRFRVEGVRISSRGYSGSSCSRRPRPDEGTDGQTGGGWREGEREVERESVCVCERDRERVCERERAREREGERGEWRASRKGRMVVRDGLVCKDHRCLCHSTLGPRALYDLYREY